MLLSITQSSIKGKNNLVSMALTSYNEAHAVVL